MIRASRVPLKTGWPMLLGLSSAQIFSWGILYYSFPVFIVPVETEMGWSRTQVTGAFSLALLVSGLAAVPVGHWVDARGARGLMTAGSVMGAFLFLALSTVTSLSLFYVLWAGTGVAMAMVLYEPAFAVVAIRFARDRDRALTILTLFGGLASTLMVPLAAWLLEAKGWRGAVAALAMILAATTIPLHALALREHPSAMGSEEDGAGPAAPAMLSGRSDAALGTVLADRTFHCFVAAFTLASLAAVATSVHAIPFLTARGVGLPTAGAVLGAIGLMQLPGRVIFGPLRRRLPWPWMAALVFLMQATGVAILSLATSVAALAAFACFFGMGNGMSTLLRASTFADLYAVENYGRVSGVLALFTTIGRAAGPVIASLVLTASGSYESLFALLAVAMGGAAVLLLRSAKALT